MKIASYHYVTGSVLTDLGMEIPDIDRDAVSYMAYKKYTTEYMSGIEPFGKGK